MHIHKLIEQATPGPIEVCEESGKMGLVSRTLRCATPLNKFGGKQHIAHVREVYSSSGEIHTSVIMSEPDAKLLAHCRNNFLRALEALEAANITMQKGRMPGPWTALIKELETVS